MVQRFLRIFDRELSGLHQAAFFLAAATVGSKILALLRDRFLASTFGAGKTLDIYYASFILPDYLYTFLLFIVSAWALIPFFLEKISRSEKEGQDFLNEIFTTFFVLAVIFAAILFFLIPYLAPFIAPGFSPDEQSRVIDLSRILLLSPILLGLSNLISGVIQSLRRFIIYALAPIFYNIGIILGVLVFYRFWGFIGVIIGVIVGASLHFFIQIPALLRAGFLPKFTSKVQPGEIKKVVKISFGRGLALTFNQFVLTVITALASLVGPGSIAVFNLAVNLQAIPLTIIGVSYSVAAFPTLAQFYVKDEKDKFLEHILTASRHIIFWSFPIMALFIVLRAQIVRVILGAGAFGWTDTRLTAASLALLSLAIAAQGMMFLLSRAYFAAGRTKTPVMINFFSSLFVIGGAFLFLWIFKNFENIQIFLARVLRVGDVVGAEMLVLPLIFSLGTILNSFLLLIFFQKDFGGLIVGLKKAFFQVLAASAAAALLTYLGLMLFAEILNTRTFIGIFLQGFFSGILGIMAGVIILRFFKSAELEEIVSSLKQKFWRRIFPIAVEPEKLP
jgi:putative peptidoglycan lipid II flippase